MAALYNKLRHDQIVNLKAQGCSSDDWNLVLVKDSFCPDFVKNVHFSGEIKIGSNYSVTEFPGGVKKHCGIYNASIHNCTIGDHVHISNVSNYIANYDIDDHVVIENLELCLIDGESSFGNGIYVSVLDETGGRKIPIYDKLSAHLAYVMTFYKHRHKAICELESKIYDYSEQVKSKKGFIGKGTRILNCKQIINVKFGSFAVVNGVLRLENGSVNSNELAPVKLGMGVSATNFIISSGSEIDEGTIIQHCFIGQGCSLSKQYSAEHSLFFANCQGFHGEACSIFAGPYTVTHHKSTLLIAGMFSFCNAGSGSNQSNHMYKLGPIHHGIVERGSKTTSDSYLLWPAKVGAFSLVMGRHYKNTDTSDLPFSYLIENKDDSWLSPAVNLRSVGTIRDVMKWPKRDKRTDLEKLDCINFNLLSPFTIQKMLKALAILKDLQKVSGKTTDIYTYQRTLINKHALERGIDLYTKAVFKFLGNSIISRIEMYNVKNFDDILECLKPKHEVGKGDWNDLAGLIAPRSEVKRILDNIEAKRYQNLAEIEKDFLPLHENYYDYEWTWAAHLLQQVCEKEIYKLSIQDLIDLIEKWQESVIAIDNLLYKDAEKEFRLEMMTGFGMDGNDDTKQADFEKVRGKFESNDFVKEILNHIERKKLLGERMVNKLKLISRIEIEAQ